MALKLILLAVLLLLALTSASARQDRRVRNCIKQKNCIARGHRAVCAENQDGDTGSFPNDCYRRCANRERGVHWSKLYSYPTSQHCIRNWLSDPDCSTCPTR
ncbi:hypothetical protein COHA_007909 [Chlorella ohadii]|uniref:Uncharacterized protein n=1 Tax=Chlorella ohadii TaxID=2649997 RepID=A0AAD5GZE5_9CHLO|nr:hypothetical protein COHA_007909 [Chlorella ohadii]